MDELSKQEFKVHFQIPDSFDIQLSDDKVLSIDGLGVLDKTGVEA